MEHHAQKVQTPWWHGLMYATGLLLIVCGIPATVIFCIVLRFTHDKSMRLDGSQAILFEASMIAAEAFIASALLYVAEKLTKHRQKIMAKHGVADA